MTPYPPSFEVFCGFQNHVVQTFRLKAYHFTTVVLFLEDMFVYCTHCFSVNRWTKCHIIWSIVAMDIWLLSNMVPVLILFFPVLQRTPFAVFEHNQNQCIPSFTFRILPPQFRHLSWNVLLVQILQTTKTGHVPSFSEVCCRNTSTCCKCTTWRNYYKIMSFRRGWRFSVLVHKSFRVSKSAITYRVHLYIKCIITCKLVVTY